MNPEGGDLLTSARPSTSGVPVIGRIKLGEGDVPDSASQNPSAEDGGAPTSARPDVSLSGGGVPTSARPSASGKDGATPASARPSANGEDGDVSASVSAEDGAAPVSARPNVIDEAATASARPSESPDEVRPIVSARTRAIEDEEEPQSPKPPSAPSPPEKVALKLYGEGTIKICWDPVEDLLGVTHYAIALKHDGVTEFVHAPSGKMVSDKALAGPVAGHTTSVTVFGLSAGIPYKARVAAKNEIGWGAYSAYSDWLTIHNAPPPPGKPTIEVLSTSSIKINWNAVEHVPQVLNFKVLVNDGTRKFFSPSTGKLERLEVSADILPSRITAVTVIGLSSKVPFRAQVASSNGTGWSPYSEFSDPVVIVEPVRPRRPVAKPVDESSIRISWTPVEHMPEVSHYAVLVEVDGTPTFFKSTFTRLPKDADEVPGGLVVERDRSAAVPQRVTAVLVKGLTLGSICKARVCAKNDIGWGTWSKSSNFVTVQPKATPESVLSALSECPPIEIEDWDAGSIQAPAAPCAENGPDSP